jgi:hypothetical protein
LSDSRRQFLQSASLATLAPFLVPGASNLLAQGPNTATSTVSFDPGVLDFWMNRVRSPYDDFKLGLESKGNPPSPQPQDSTFVFPSPSKGLVPAGTLSPDDFKDFPASGDMDVEVHVERFRPSPSDAASLANLASGTLRIDVKQVTPLPGLPEALAWTAMATLASKQKGQAVPTLDTPKFDPGTAWGMFQKVPLTAGLGFWSWNFFMKKREGFWGQFLDVLFATVKPVEPILPLLGIPGIAVSGLKFLDQFVGALQAQGDSTWMFRGLDVPVCATKESFNGAGAPGANKLLLTTGSYIVIPEVSVSKLDKNFEIQQGLIVPPKTPPLQIFDAAKTILPTVSYMTISVVVSPSKAGNAAKAAKPA